MIKYETDTPVQGELRSATFSALGKFAKMHEENRKIMSEEEKIIDERTFNYYFVEGEEVKIDTNIFKKDSEFTPDNMKLEPHIDKKGIVTNCYSDVHSFGRGWSYRMDVNFDGVLVKHILSWYLIPYKD